MASNSDSSEYALKALAEQVFGTKVVNILKDKKMTYRDIWETSSPTTQCGNTIGDAVDGVSICWLCGFAIDMSIDAFKPECEHVLPVGQALLFLDLYKHSIHKGDLSKELSKMLKLEYRWSHSVCNRIKSDTNFLGFNSKGIPIILEGVIREYLAEIYSKSDDLKILVGRGRSARDWNESRLADISKQLNHISKFINEKTTGLLLLSGVAALFEPENIASSLRTTITPEKIEVVPKIQTLTVAFNRNEFKKLRYFIEYKSNLTSQIKQVTNQLSTTMGFKLKEKDKDTAFILSLRKKYDLKRTADYDEALKEHLLAIVRDNLIAPFENVMNSNEFKGLYLTYSNYITPNKLTTDLFNPFLLELIYMCLLCLVNNEISKNVKLNGALDSDIEAIQQIWVTKCKDEYYKLFFCRMTELYITNGVISTNIIKCVMRVDCSTTPTNLDKISKLDFFNEVPVVKRSTNANKVMAPKNTTGPLLRPRIITDANANTSKALVPRAPNANTSKAIVPRAPTANTSKALVPRAPNANTSKALVPRAPNANTSKAIVPRAPTANASKAPSCSVCPTTQPCPAVPSCPNAKSSTSKTMLEQLLEEVEKERGSTVFGGSRKRRNVNFNLY
jgi:hypothetical protein